MKVQPDPHLIASLAAQNLAHWKALSEWIDNSLDAGASVVSVAFGKRGTRSFLSVEDDGCGCSDLLTFARLGSHQKHKSTRSGTHGIGSKDAALWYGGVKSRFYIRSTRDGIEHRLLVDWDRMIREDWDVADPEQKPSPEPSGTALSVEPCQRQPPHGKSWDELVATLGYIYALALEDGRQIKIRRDSRSEWTFLRPWKLPTLIPETVIDATVTVEGKTAHVHAGIVHSGTENHRPGLTYAHGFRVIKPATHLGCGDAQIARICGVVRVDDSWTRSKNKDDLVRADELYAAVERVLRPLLERAEREGMLLRCAAFTQALEQQVNALVPLRAKEKRSSGNSAGTSEPKGTGAKRTRAAQEQAGNSIRSSRDRAITIRWGRFESERPARCLGRHGETVELNEASPLLLKWREEQQHSAVLAIVLVAIANFEVTHEATGQSLLRGFDGDVDFMRTLGSLMSSPTMELDGKRVREDPPTNSAGGDA